jgi:hypothetical protein
VVNDANNNEFNATAWWQPPPEMKISRTLPSMFGEDEVRPEAKVLEKDPNSSLISIGYRRN